MPKELLGFADVAGQRSLCAVPCDVQWQDRLLAVRAQAASAIALGPAGGESLGTVSFVVNAPDGKLYAVAPIHVLSPSLPLDGRGVVGGNLAWRVIGQEAPADQELLRSTLKGGALRPFKADDPVESLDVQLAEVTDRAKLREALQGWKLSAKQPMVTGEPALAALMVTRRAYLMVPSNHPHAPAPRLPIEVTLSMGERLHFPTYHFGGGEPVAARHRVLELCLLDGQRSLHGDSGSAVVLDLGQGEFSLIGMHIAAGEPSGNSFVIPAWRMFNPMAYLKVDGQWFDGPVTLARSW